VAAVDGGASVVEVVDSVVLEAVALVVVVLRGGLVVDVGRGCVVVVVVVLAVVVVDSLVVVVVGSVGGTPAKAAAVNVPRATALTSTSRSIASDRCFLVSTSFTRS
jgi:hypothetical protein